MTPTERPVYLGLGGNQGDREAILERAVEEIGAWPGTVALRRSPIYETAYVGPHGPQEPYLNLCLRVDTTAPLAEIHAWSRALEREAGRPPGRHQMPRPLDVDVLLDDDRVHDDPELRVPHPRLRERRFVLQPLCDLDPDLRIPPDGTTVAALLAAPAVRAQSLSPWEVEG